MTNPGTWLAVLVITVSLLGSLRLRTRVRALPVLAAGPDDAGGPAGGTSRDGTGLDGAYRLLTAEGTDVSDAVRSAAAEHARREGLAVLDLIPADLPVEAALDLVTRLDPAKYREDRLAPGVGAGQAVLISAEVARRAGAGAQQRLDAGEFIRLTMNLKHYAPASAGHVIVPGMRAAPYPLGRRRACLAALGQSVSVALTGPILGYAAVVAALVLHPLWWGLAAAVVYSAGRCVVFAGCPLRPRDLPTTLLRLVRDPYVWGRTATGTWRSRVEIAEDEQRAAARPRYLDDIARGTDRFFEPRRGTCPWCGSGELSVRLRTPDLIQRKPGTFVLEQCRACGHVFQNPRLSPEGLDFYYRDFYDGAGTRGTDVAFSTQASIYLNRARMVVPFATPKSWLDVGTGHAHFCNYARQVWPDTVFDGLDLGAEVEEAARRGWISTAHRGSFPDRAADLAGRYDVVSMHHYLEHTRDPFAELDAAATVVKPGGLVMIEVPDPQYRLSRLFGRFWSSWLQPQHQHMMPIANLGGALAQRGLTPVAQARGEAHLPVDFTAAALMCANLLAPDISSAWATVPPSRIRRVRRSCVWTAALPVLAAGYLLDRLVAVAVRRGGQGNTYRVLARKEDGDA